MQVPVERIVVAMSAEHVIGAAGGLPWSLPEELQHFRRLTWGGTLVMGGRTFAGIGRALPGRDTIVVSSRQPPLPGITVCPSFAEAVVRARAAQRPIFYAGGVGIYRAALERAGGLDVSWIRGPVAGDTYFPPYAAEAWQEEARQDYGTFVYVRYRRVPVAEEPCR